MITKEARATLWTLWKSEDAEWRKYLNEEQAALVRLWDWAYADEVRPGKVAAPS